MSLSGTKCVGTNGPRCKRCRQPTQIWEHEQEPVGRHYWRWYRCANPRCKTTTIMPPEFYTRKRRQQPDDEYEATLARCRAYKGPAPF